jgi:hypothetical protein
MINDEMVKITGTLREFLNSQRCEKARCEEWVQGLGDDVIVAGQVAVAVCEANDIIEAIASGLNVGNRVENLLSITAPFERAEIIIGSHKLIEIYREVIIEIYRDKIDSYVSDIRKARTQIVASAVDHIAKKDRGTFDLINKLMSVYSEIEKNISRGDLIILGKQIDTLQPSHIAQLATLQIKDLKIEKNDSSLLHILTLAWREVVANEIEKALKEIRSLDNEFSSRPEILAAVSGRESVLPIPYRIADIAKAFAWRTSATLVILPAALAEIIIPITGWDSIELSDGKPKEDVLEICETLYDPHSNSYDTLARAYLAAQSL